MCNLCFEEDLPFKSNDKMWREKITLHLETVQDFFRWYLSECNSIFYIIGCGLWLFKLNFSWTTCSFSLCAKENTPFAILVKPVDGRKCYFAACFLHVVSFYLCQGRVSFVCYFSFKNLSKWMQSTWKLFLGTTAYNVKMINIGPFNNE